MDRRAWQDIAAVKGNRVAPCVLLVAVGSAVNGCGRPHGNADIAGTTIRYQVEYDSTAVGRPSQRALSISYATDDGEQEQTDVGLPWTKVVSAGAGFTAVVRAQYAGSGLIACRVVADGKVIDQQMSVGPYAVVECASN
jgi:hypothetical protein